jgi:glutamate N-acetyltransferase/amino-acid N-acetyltransferase
MPDLALLLSDSNCSGAGVFTKNQVVAAPVILDRETLALNSVQLRGVVANAGIANACTGPAGLEAARATQRMAAEAFGCKPTQVLVLSTGLIGVQLDLDKIESGIRQAAPNLSPENGPSAARAIMTTDTIQKHNAVRVHLPEGDVTIGGMAKGAGMIHPDMATMLCVLTTDAMIEPELLAELLSGVVDRSFNRISVDGDTSTNDSVLFLANGASEVLVANGASEVLVKGDASRAAFMEGLDWICLDLAHSIVRDGEGASKFVALQVTGAREEAEALRVASTIATSSLVKTALAGGDPNWGRILAASGRAGVDLTPDSLRLWIGRGQDIELQLLQDGAPLPYSEAKAFEVFRAPEITVRLDLGLGEASGTIWTCDLTQEYVSINAEYHT